MTSVNGTPGGVLRALVPVLVLALQSCATTGCAWIPGATTSGGTITQSGVGSGNIVFDGKPPAVVTSTAVSSGAWWVLVGGGVLAVVAVLVWLRRRAAATKAAAQKAAG